MFCVWSAKSCLLVYVLFLKHICLGFLVFTTIGDIFSEIQNTSTTKEKYYNRSTLIVCIIFQIKPGDLQTERWSIRFCNTSLIMKLFKYSENMAVKWQRSAICGYFRKLQFVCFCVVLRLAM